MKKDMKDMDVKDFVEKELDKINSAGEWLGDNLGSLGRTAQKILIGVGVLFVFGIAIFFYAVGKGIVKKR
jgi:hypothetical protein